MTATLPMSGKAGKPEAKPQSVAFTVPDDQRMIYRITPSPGHLLSLEAIGGQMVAIAKLLKAAARETDKERKWHVALIGIRTDVDGSVEFEIAIAPLSGDDRRLSNPPRQSGGT